MKLKYDFKVKSVCCYPNLCLLWYLQLSEEPNVSSEYGSTDMCALLTRVLYWHVCSTDTCALLTRVLYWHGCSTNTCALRTRVLYWHVCSTDTCALLTRVLYWHVCSTDTCALLTRVLYQHVCSTDMCALRNQVQRRWNRELRHFKVLCNAVLPVNKQWMTGYNRYIDRMLSACQGHLWHIIIQNVLIISV